MKDKKKRCDLVNIGLHDYLRRSAYKLDLMANRKCETMKDN